MLTKTTRRGNDPVANAFDGEAITFTYDNLNRLLERHVPGSAGDDKFVFTYDLAGRRLTALHDGTTLAYAYDNAGRMLSQSHGGALPVSYQYDKAGNNTKLTYPDGFDVDFTYDALSRVSTAKDGARVLATLTYDRLSRRQSVAYANGTSASYAFTSRGDLTDHDWSFAGGANANYDFTYSGVGQLLTESVSDALLEWLPAMDSVDNYTANGLNQYTDIKGVAPVYDGNGNTTTDHRGRSYVYDAENVMRSASGLASGTASYDYWADGARRSKTYDSVTSVFYYTGDQEIAEYEGSTLTRRFVRLPGSVDEPFLMIDNTLDAACTSATYATCEVWAHQNRLGSVVATTDSGGTVIEKYTYSSYGVSDDATGFPFRFTGQKLDSETGLYYYKARYYDPEVGRFLQTDPIGYEDQMNLYGYVYNDPINNIDPLGLQGVDNEFQGLTPEELQELRKKAAAEGDTETIKKIEAQEKANGERNKQKRANNNRQPPKTKKAKKEAKAKKKAKLITPLDLILGAAGAVAENEHRKRECNNAGANVCSEQERDDEEDEEDKTCEARDEHQREACTV